MSACFIMISKSECSFVRCATPKLVVTVTTFSLDTFLAGALISMAFWVQVGEVWLQG
jgi:Na+/glutamate symporter